MLDIAHDTSVMGVNSKASKYRKSIRQVRRVQKAVAMAFLRIQFKLFPHLARRMLENFGKPTCAKLIIDFLLSDETRQRLRMSLGAPGCENSHASRASQAPHPSVRFAAYAESVSRQRRVLEVHWVSPPTAMLTTTAGSLHAVFEVLPGMGSHRSYKLHWDVMVDNTTDALRIRTLDGATTNPPYTHTASFYATRIFLMYLASVSIAAYTAPIWG